VVRRGHSTVLAVVGVALLLAATASMAGPASSAGADLGSPDRPSVPALIPASQPHALPSDSSTVRIAMTENDGLDVIVTSPAGVSAPGVPSAAAVRFHQTAGTWEVDTGPGCAGPWNPVSTAQSTPTASPVSNGLLTVCVASYSPTVHGTVTALYNSVGL